MKTYTAHIVGTGRIAGYLEDDPLRDHPCTHAGTYKSMPCVELRSCAGKTMEKSLKFAMKFGIPYCYEKLEDMLKYQDMDILSVCTPAELHVPFVIQAARSGRVKAIYCEKALGLSLKEAEEAVKTCRINRVPLIVNYLRRWSGDTMMAKKIIDEGQLGQIQTVHAVFSGHIMHTGTHMFDLLLYFLGNPLWVRSRIEKFRPSDSDVSGYKYINDEYFDDPSATAQLRFPGEVDVFISGLEKHYFIFEMDIIGSRGRIRLGNFMKELWLSRQSPHYKDFRELVRAPFPETPGSKNAWLRAVEDIINQINGCPGVGSTGEEACRSMEMAFGIMLSSLKNGSRISFPLEERDIKIISK